MVCVVCFFFFKQKTAYDMRISDWSSDVCSSDLPRTAGFFPSCRWPRCPIRKRLHACPQCHGPSWPASAPRNRPRQNPWPPCAHGNRHRQGLFRSERPLRSEEHTSELQSLMRISYAVFCLKKKKQIIYTQIRDKTSKK